MHRFVCAVIYSRLYEVLMFLSIKNKRKKKLHVSSRTIKVGCGLELNKNEEMFKIKKRSKCESFN
jgi:hypothetical protein